MMQSKRVVNILPASQFVTIPYTSRNKISKSSIMLSKESLLKFFIAAVAFSWILGLAIK